LRRGLSAFPPPLAGFALFKPAPQSSTATFHDAAGKRLFACKLGPGEVACD
jgi:hypothetical protein